jgi:hypothetical protein
MLKTVKYIIFIVKTSKRRKNHPVSYKVLKERKNRGLVQIYWRKQETKYKNAVSTFKLKLSKIMGTN